MNLIHTHLTRSMAALALAVAAAVPSHAETAVPVEDFSVFVDMPTGFAFVKTPSGWRFVRQIEASKLSQLHPTTLVSVIQAGQRFSQVEAQASSVQQSQPQL